MTYNRDRTVARAERGLKGGANAPKVEAAEAMHQVARRAEELEEAGDKAAAFREWRDAIVIARGLKFMTTASRYLPGLLRTYNSKDPSQVAVVEYLAEGLPRDLEGASGAASITVRGPDGAVKTLPDRYNKIGFYPWETSYGRLIHMSPKQYLAIKDFASKTLDNLAKSIGMYGSVPPTPRIEYSEADECATFGLFNYGKANNSRVVREVDSFADNISAKALRRDQPQEDW